MSGSVSLINGHIDNHHIDLWVEGYQCTGGSNTASYLGTYKADSIREAVQQWVAENPKERERYVDISRLTYWGCKFYNNECHARRSFG